MSGNHDNPCLKGGWHAWIGDDAGDSWCEKCGEPLWEKDEAKAASPLVAGKDYEDINTTTNKELRGELIAAHSATPRQSEAKQSSPLVVTRNGVPCEDRAAALEEFKQACRPRLEPEDYERIREALESLNEYPTEEETEAILRKHGTSGEEVINAFIWRLLRENLGLSQRLESLTLKCGKCGHLKRDFVNGTCETEIQSPYYGDGDYRQGKTCGCQCEFPIGYSPSATLEYDQFLAVDAWRCSSCGAHTYDQHKFEIPTFCCRCGQKFSKHNYNEHLR